MRDPGILLQTNTTGYAGGTKKLYLWIEKEDPQ